MWPSALKISDRGKEAGRTGEDVARGVAVHGTNVVYEHSLISVFSCERFGRIVFDLVDLAPFSILDHES